MTNRARDLEMDFRWHNVPWETPSLSENPADDGPEITRATSVAFDVNSTC